MGKRRRAQDACPQALSPCAEERSNTCTKLPTPLNQLGDPSAKRSPMVEAINHWAEKNGANTPNLVRYVINKKGSEDKMTGEFPSPYDRKTATFVPTHQHS